MIIPTLDETPVSIYSFNKRSKDVVKFLNSSFRFVESFTGETPTTDCNGYFYSTFSSAFPVDSSMHLNEEKVEEYLTDLFNFTKNKQTKISWAQEPEATLDVDAKGVRSVKLQAILTAR